MGQILKNISHVVRGQWHEFYRNNILEQDSQERLEEELRTLYGRGEITRDRFIQLRFQLHWGRVSHTDFYVIHQQARRLAEAQGRYIPHWSNPELERELDRLYADRVLVEETYQRFEENIQNLRKEVHWIKEEAESARQNAEKILPFNEEGARASLEIWQKLLSLSNTLDSYIQTMQEDMAGLNTLEVEIKAAITRIKLLHSREQMVEMDQRIRRDMLAQG